MKIFFYTLFASFIIFPNFVMSQPFQGTIKFISSITGIVRTLLTVTTALALLVFIWGIVKFILAQADGDKTGIDSGKVLLKWGLIALFVLGSVQGIIYFIQGELQLPQTGLPGQQVLPSRNPEYEDGDDI